MLLRVVFLAAGCRLAGWLPALVAQERDLAKETWQTRPGKIISQNGPCARTWQRRPGKGDLAKETWQRRPWQWRPIRVGLDCQVCAIARSRLPGLYCQVPADAWKRSRLPGLDCQVSIARCPFSLLGCSVALTEASALWRYVYIHLLVCSCAYTRTEYVEQIRKWILS